MPIYNAIAWDNGNKVYWNIEGIGGINYVDNTISAFMQQQNLGNENIIQEKQKLTYEEANFLLGDKYFNIDDGKRRKGKDFHAYTFSVPELDSEGKIRLFRIGAVEYTEIKAYPNEVAELIEKGIARLLTEQERAIPYPRIQVVTISSEVQAIINKFDNNDYLIPSGVNAGIELVKNGTITNDLFLKTFNNLLQTGIITDKTITTPTTPTVPTVPTTPTVPTVPTIPTEQTWCIDVYQINQFGGVYSTHYENVKREALLIWEESTLVKECGSPIPSDQEVKDFYNFADTSINDNMVSQSIGAFTLKDGKVTGNIIYIAESAFNPYYYNKPVTSIVQIKDQTGNTIKLKTNNLNFTETERDETITINEGVGNLNAVKIEFYVWKGINEPISFALQKVDEIVAQEIGLSPCPIGQHRNFNNKCVPDDQTIGGRPSVLGLFGGVTALLGTLALLGSKGR